MVCNARQSGPHHCRPTSAVANSVVVREGTPRTRDSHEAHLREIKHIDDHVFGYVANRDSAVQTTRMESADI